LPKILIVDDDRTTVKLLQTLLQMDGFEVATASRGQLALEHAQASPPDIFLIDYLLSDMDGVELTTTLRTMSQFAQTPIVMASGMNVEDQAMKSGADLFLIKPFEPGQLANMFHKLLG
jgi:DNA-binding response OmpR family regulator